MANFASVIELRARCFRLPRRRRNLARRSQGLASPVLQCGPRIQPLEYVAFNVAEQAHKIGIAGAALPELYNGRGCFFRGDALGDEVAKHREGRNEAASARL